MSDVLPRAMRELWGLGSTGRRGPKPALTVATIADEAVRLADGDGLDAVTMEAVAKRLGYTTMSLYRYVDSRQDLVAAMADRAIGEPPEGHPRRGWRRRLEEWAHAEHVRLRGHPWILDLRTATPPIGPNMVGWTEAGFACLSDCDLPPDVVATTLLTVDGMVRNAVQLWRQYSGPESALWADQLREVVDADSHPAMSAILASGAFEDGSPDEGDFGDDELAFALGTFLDGVELLRPRA